MPPRPLLAAFTVLAVGCSSPYAGEWSGDCDPGGSTTDLPVTLDLADDKGSTLTGVGTFVYNDYTFEGEADGRVVDDDVLELDIIGVYGGYTITVSLEGELDLDSIEGSCTFTDQDTLYEGDLELEQKVEE